MEGNAFRRESQNVEGYSDGRARSTNLSALIGTMGSHEAWKDANHLATWFRDAVTLTDRDAKVRQLMAEASDLTRNPRPGPNASHSFDPRISNAFLSGPTGALAELYGGTKLMAKDAWRSMTSPAASVDHPDGPLTGLIRSQASADAENADRLAEYRGIPDHLRAQRLDYTHPGEAYRSGRALMPPKARPVASNYEPTWRDRIAQMLIGNSRDPRLQRSVRNLLGTGGLEGDGFGAIDVLTSGAADVGDAFDSMSRGQYRAAATDIGDAFLARYLPRMAVRKAEKMGAKSKSEIWDRYFEKGR